MITVLYVDDDSHLLQLGKIFLERNGEIAVTTVMSVAEGLSELASGRFDAIVSDYQMPGEDGIAFLKQVRERYHDLPFIILTGRGRESVVIEAINNGVDFYIQKGMDAEAQFAELAHKVRLAVEQRRIRTSLKDLERREADILNFLPDPTFAIDAKGTVIAWNEAMERLTRVPARQMVGKGEYEYSLVLAGERKPTLIDLVMDPDSPARETFSSLERDGRSMASEVQFPTLHPEEERWFRVTASIFYDSEGRVAGAVESVRDITEGKQFNARLKESEARYRAIFECTDAATVIIEADGTISLANQAFATLSGYPVGEVTGKKKWMEFVVPEELERMWEYHLARRTNGGTAPEVYEFRFRDRYGVVKYILLHIGVIPGTRRTVASLLNVTSLKKAGEELLEKNNELSLAYSRLASQEEKLRAQVGELERQQQAVLKAHREIEQIIDFLPDAAYVIGRDHIVTSCNHAMEELIGMKRSEVLGKNSDPIMNALYGEKRPGLIDFVVDGDVSRAAVYYSSLRTEGDMLVAEPVHASPLGRSMVLWIKARPFYDTNGAVTGAIETIRDMTGQWLLRESLEQANRKLNLLSSITRHDIMNQVTVAIGMSVILRQEIDDPAALKHLDMLENAIKTINTQVDFTRNYQDIGIEAPSWQDIGNILSKCKSSQLTFSNDVHGIEVYADPMLSKVFLNLLDNSVKHGGHVTRVHVSAVVTGRNLVVAWEDDGVGIPAADKERIFEKHVGKHTGLGLYLAREILGITGISIRETGNPGQNARFEITVPAGAFRTLRPAQ